MSAPGRGYSHHGCAHNSALRNKLSPPHHHHHHHPHKTADHPRARPQGIESNENHGSHNRYDLHQALCDSPERRAEYQATLSSSSGVNEHRAGLLPAAAAAPPPPPPRPAPYIGATGAVAAAEWETASSCLLCARGHGGEEDLAGSLNGCEEHQHHHQQQLLLLPVESESEYEPAASASSSSLSTSTGAGSASAHLSDMGVGSSKHGYQKHQHKKRHCKSSTQKIIVQQASPCTLDNNDNENNRRTHAHADPMRLPIAETKAVQNNGIDISKFKVIKLKAAIDRKPTTLDEKSSAVLKYRTPHFRSLATVELPTLEPNQGVQIGWIQTCTEMRFVNTYGDEGVTSWEFPEIVSEKYQMIGDADGKQYPWYGSKNELTVVHGPTKEPQTVTVHMNDNFFPQVTWYVPEGLYDKTPRLTHIHRRQKFFTYLVAQDLSAQRYHILHVVEWSMELNIAVNPTNPLGKRAKLLGPMEQQQPRVMPTSRVPLQPYALKPPNANNAQTLVWRPKHADPKIIVPPIESTMDMEKYIIATRGMDMSVHRTGHS